jgi:hypothetical protein
MAIINHSAFISAFFDVNDNLPSASALALPGQGVRQKWQRQEKTARNRLLG